MKTEQGFTLIELLVVIGVIGILTFIITDTLVNTLRGENKIKILNQVKQNGQVVLDTMVNEIRQAKEVICIGDHDNDTINDTIVVFGRETHIRFRYMRPLPVSNPSANGYIRRDDFKEVDLPVGGASGLCLSEEVSTFKNFILTNKNLLSGVSIRHDGSSAVFSERARSGYSSIITIRFRVAEGVGAGKAYEKAVEEGGVLFTTAVQIRGGR